jgi:GDP-4-dehydro-6-deoxy-D-mannose reductase
MSGSALITGADGFVGKHLSTYLRDRGWTVHGSVLQDPADASERACDLRDPVQVERLVGWAGYITHVFHLAAMTFNPEANADPTAAFAVNVHGTVHLARAWRAHRPKARFVYASTSEVYGPPQFTPITEDHPVNPQQPYAISKLAADEYCAYLYRSEDADAVRVRPFNHSGAGQSELFVLSSFARQVAAIEAGQAPACLRVGNLDVARDFLHVSDVLRAYELIALEGRAGEVYHVCSGAAQPLREVVDKLRAMARVPIEVEVHPDRVRQVDAPQVVGSYEKLRTDTGWVPEVPFDSVLVELLDYWRERLAQSA